MTQRLSFHTASEAYTAGYTQAVRDHTEGTKPDHPVHKALREITGTDADKAAKEIAQLTRTVEEYEELVHSLIQTINEERERFKGVLRYYSNIGNQGELARRNLAILEEGMRIERQNVANKFINRYKKEEHKPPEQPN